MQMLNGKHSNSNGHPGDKSSLFSVPIVIYISMQGLMVWLPGLRNVESTEAVSAEVNQRKRIKITYVHFVFIIPPSLDANSGTIVSNLYKSHDRRQEDTRYQCHRSNTFSLCLPS